MSPMSSGVVFFTGSHNAQVICPLASLTLWMLGAQVTFADAEGTPHRAVLQHAPGLAKPFQQLGELCFAELPPASRPHTAEVRHFEIL